MRVRAREAEKLEFPKYRRARLDSLIPNERNPRIHTREAVDQLARQIGEMGWTNPIIVAGKDILAGHRRRLAAMQRGMEFVPVIDVSHFSAAQRMAYIIWDNKSTIDGDWDDDLLTLMLGDYRDAGGDLSLTGFNERELATLFDEVEDTDPSPGRGATSRDGPTTIACPNCHHEFAP